MTVIDQNLVEFEFFLWEYQRRNAKYRNSILALIDDVVATLAEPLAQEANEIAAANDKLPDQGASLATPPNPEDLGPDDSYEVHGCDFTVGVSPADILKIQRSLFATYSKMLGPHALTEFINNNKRYPRHPDSGFSGQEMVEAYLIREKVIDFELDHFHIPNILSSFEIDAESGKMHATFDMEHGPGIASQETAWYMSLAWAIILENQEPPDPSAAKLREKSDIALNQMRRWWAKRGKGRLTIAREPRIIGLWLWDCQQEEGTSPEEAIQSFLERFSDYVDEKFQGQSSNPIKLKEHLEMTRRCIESAEVLYVVAQPKN